MAKITFTAILEPATDGVGVSFPDLPGCVSWGEDAGEAVRNAEEALALHLGGMVEDNEAVPEPTPLGVLIRQAYIDHGQHVTYAAITVEEPSEGERVNIYLSKMMLRRIDNYCAPTGGKPLRVFRGGCKVTTDDDAANAVSAEWL